MAADERDDDLILNTHRNSPVDFRRVGAPSNFRQMRFMMSRIVEDMREQGVTDPSNEDVMREYARRVREARKKS